MPSPMPANASCAPSFMIDRKTSCALRSKRDADANLPRALRHEKGQDAVDADRSERERQAGKRDKSVVTDAGDATASETVARMVCTSLTGISWLRPAMVWRSVASTARGVGGRDDSDGHLCRYATIFERRLRAIRHVHRADNPVGHVLPEVVRAHVPHDSHDGVPVRLADEPDLLADRTVLRPESPRRCPRNDGHRRVAREIRIRERSAGRPAGCSSRESTRA